MATVAITRRPREALLVAAAIGAGVGVGLVSVARIDGVGPFTRAPFSMVTTLPVSVFFVLAGAAIATLVAAKTWWVGLALFFAWLPFEDLVRKFAANDLRVYFVKDLLLILAFATIAPRLAGCWRKPLGTAWAPLMAVLVVAVMMAIPSFVSDPRIPIAGLRVRFLFLLLLPIGVFIGRDASRLRRALVALCLLSIVVCGIGIAQSIIGVEFLNPAEPVTNLTKLSITKNLGDVVVERPSGPFVDAGRFGTMTTVAVALGLCLLRVAAMRRDRNVAVATIATASVASFVSGGRAAFVFAAALVAISLVVLRPPGESRRSALLIVVIGVIGVGAFAAASGSAAKSENDEAAYYAATLNPLSETTELGPRIGYYVREAYKGVAAGGLGGRGTGSQSLGQQYYAAEFSDIEYTSESGWGSVATEWGFGGLVVWLVWTIAWIRRSRFAARHFSSPSGPAVPVITVFVVVILVVNFTLGVSSIDNYISNIFLWFLSGVAFAAIPPNNDSEGSATDVAGSRAEVAPT